MNYLEFFEDYDFINLVGLDINFSSVDLNVIEILDLSFCTKRKKNAVSIGKFKYILFESFQRGYFPYDFVILRVYDELIISLIREFNRTKGKKKNNIKCFVLTSLPLNLLSCTDSVDFVSIIKNKETEIVYHDKNFSLENLDELVIELASLVYSYVDLPIVGDFVVYLPNKRQIKALIHHLLLLRTNANIFVCWNSKGTKEIRTLKETQENQLNQEKKRKIIITTFSSLRENVGVVFDSMLVKGSTKGNSGGDKVVFIDKEEAIKRSQGLTYRLCKEKFFQELPNIAVRKVNVVKEYIMLSLAGIDLSILEYFPEPLVKQAIIDVGSLHIFNNEDIAKFVLKSPFSLYSSMLLCYFIMMDLPIYPGIVTAALIDNAYKSYFKLPEFKGLFGYKQTVAMEKHIKEFFTKYQSSSDLESYLKLWNDMTSQLQGFNVSVELILSYCRLNSINFEAIMDVIHQVNNASRTLGKFTKIVFEPFSVDELMKKLYDIITIVYDARKMHSVDEIIYADYYSNRYTYNLYLNPNRVVHDTIYALDILNGVITCCIPKMDIQLIEDTQQMSIES
jgi:HrpA-like helicases